MKKSSTVKRKIQWREESQKKAPKNTYTVPRRGPSSAGSSHLPAGGEKTFISTRRTPASSPGNTN